MKNKIYTFINIRFTIHNARCYVLAIYNFSDERYPGYDHM